MRCRAAGLHVENVPINHTNKLIARKNPRTETHHPQSVEIAAVDAGDEKLTRTLQRNSGDAAIVTRQKEILRWIGRDPKWVGFHGNGRNARIFRLVS